MSVTISALKRCSVRLYLLLLFVRGLMPYLRYLCLVAHSGIQHYCVVFLLNLPSSCVLCTLCCQFLWIVHFSLPFRYSLTFMCTSLIVCVPYFASFSGLSILLALSVFVTFICRSLIVRVSCFASFSGLSIMLAPSVFSNVYL